MCGFAGILSFATPPDPAVLRRMGAALAHRGPDGEGIWHDDHCGLAHRRLAILDPQPRSDQPFVEDGHVLAFNGEIYNHRALRRELPGPWHTDGDTETLLRALRTWGIDAVEKLDGMFAFAWWDAAERTLHLARDPMGQKPLYHTDGPTVRFGSELAAVRTDEPIAHDHLADYLRWGYFPFTQTAFQGIHKLPPGHTLTLKPKAEQREASDLTGQPKPYEKQHAPLAPIRKMLETAVEKRLLADVPLGVLLSGGIDSSIVSACARKHGPISTFCIGFDDPRYDERPHARRVAQHLGTDHHEAAVTPDIAEDLPKLARVFGEPFADSSALPTHYLSRFVRQHVKVALGGDGGDELFAGYDRYRAFAASFQLRPLAAIAPLIKLLPGTHPKSRVAKLKRFAAGLRLPPAERYRSFVALFDEPNIAALLPDSNRVAEQRGLALLEELLQGRSPADAVMAFDRSTYLPDDLLAKVDRASMLHGLEVRSPFMDKRLLAWADTHSPRLGKRDLQDAFADALPADVFTRRKMGFALPIGDWLRTSLRPMLHDHVLRPNGFCATHFDSPTVQRLVNEHDTKTADHSQRLYALLFLEVWNDEVTKALPLNLKGD
ncbi:MAG: asparagine synthase (glutamine-hydrolyzing) [Planctomycetota bacterium]